MPHWAQATSRNFVDFKTTTACPNNANVSLGKAAGVATMAANGSNINIGHVQLNKDGLVYFPGNVSTGTLGKALTP